MARRRWTLALILIFLPILATVITAFRLRDLPRNSGENKKLESKIQDTCDSCDVNELNVGQKLYSVNVDSAKRSYEDLKKAVREKQQIVSQTKKLSDNEINKVENNEDKNIDKSQQKPKFKPLKLETSAETINKDFKNFEKPHIHTVKYSDKSYEFDRDNFIDNYKNERSFKNTQDKEPITITIGTKTSDTIINKIEKNKKDGMNHDSNTKVKSQPKVGSNEKKIQKKFKEINFNDTSKLTKKSVYKENSDDNDNSREEKSSKNNVSKDKTIMNTKKLTASHTSKINIKDSINEKTFNKADHKDEDNGEDEDDDDDDDDHDDDDDDDDDEDDDEDEGGNIGIVSEWFQTGIVFSNSIMDSVASKINSIKESVTKRSGDGSAEIDDDDDEEDDDDDEEDDDDDDEDNNDDNDDDSEKKSYKAKVFVSKKSSELNSPPKLKSELHRKDDNTYKKQSTYPVNSEHNQKSNDNDKDKEFESLSRIGSKRDDSTKDQLDGKGNVQRPIKQNMNNPKIETEKEKKTQNIKSSHESQPSKKESSTESLKDDEIPTTKPSADSVKNVPKTKPNKQTGTETTTTSEESKIVMSKKRNELKKSENKINISVKSDDDKNHDKSKELKHNQSGIPKLHHEANKEKDKVTTEESHEINLNNRFRHVTEALQRRNLEQSEFEDFYSFFPTFAPNFSRIQNPECRRHGQILLRQLRGTKLWALNMLDATAKIPSGILQGNGIQLGDFDQCLGSRARVQLDTGSVVKVQGKYCLARLDLKAEHPDLEVPVHLAQAKNLLKSRIDDPGHFVPRFSTLSWGICLPAACESEDVEVVVKDALKHYQHASGVVVRVKVEEQDCFTHEDGSWEDWLEWPTIITLSLYAVVLLLVLVYTVQDFLAGRDVKDAAPNETDDKAECDQKDDANQAENSAESKKSDDVLSAFSLYRSTSKLLAPADAEEIPCIHGVRAVGTIALLVVHKFLPVAVIPYSNRTKITELVSSPLWSWSRAGWVFTDCFLLLSGTLTAHRGAADADTSAPRRLFSRYLRLTPALLAVVLFYSYVWDQLSTGPMWGTLVIKNAEVCRQGWWWNLLYVQNYFGFEDICAPQTHQLALDMQLTVAGCIIVWVLTQVKPRLAPALLPALHLAAAYSRYTTVRDHRLTLLFYHGVSVSQLYRTARLSYTSILHRSTAYLVGISLGLALQKPAIRNKFVLTCGWLWCVSLWAGVWWAGADAGALQYHYRAPPAALYAALAPVASATAIAWFIYAVHNGHSELLSRILCCQPLVLISRLSYALYLTQFAVFLTSAATVKSSSEFSLVALIDIQELGTIILASVILTLTFIIPLQSLHKVFTFKEKRKNTEDARKDKDLETKEENNVSHLNVKSNNTYNNRIQEIKEVLPTKNKVSFVAHREPLEEIPEVEIEYEMRREMIDGLDEILEEEEDEDEDQVEDDNMGVEEPDEMGDEIGGDDDYVEQRDFVPRRRYYMEDEQDLEEWEWTKTDGPNGDQNI